MEKMHSAGGDDGSDSDDFPSTMLRRKASSKKKKQTSSMIMETTDSNETGSPPTSPPQVAANTASPSVKIATPTPAEKLPAEKPPKAAKTVAPPSDDEDDGIDDLTLPSAQPKKKKNKSKAEQRKLKKEKEEEEEALLAELAMKAAGEVPSAVVDEASVTQDDSPAGKGSSKPKDGTGAHSTSETRSAVEQLSVCNAEWLDPRNERIKAFGRKAVEADASAQAKEHAERFGRRHLQTRGKAPVFRQSPLATPDPNTWPPYAPLGLKLMKCTKKDLEGKRIVGSPEGAVVYRLDDSSEEYRAAQHRFESVVAQFGDVNQLIELWRKQPYHLPTLLQLQSTLHTMGESQEAQRVLDMALYAVGLLFTTSSFPIGAPTETRSLPYSLESNQILFVALHRGVHEALKKGCGRTALELSKLLLSLDTTDPKHALLSLDYCALRGSQFEWLQTLFQELKDTKSPLSALPSLHYHSALAGFLQAQKAASGAKKVGVPPSDEVILERMCNAVRVYPNAAIAIADKAGEDITSGTTVWSELMASVQGYSETVADNALRHVSDLFAERSHTLWKPSAVLELLKKAVKIVSQDSQLKRIVAKEERQELQRFGMLERYYSAKQEDVMGEVNAARIPQELLQDEHTAEELAQHMRQREQQMVAVDTLEALQRMEAAFGPLEGQEHLTVEQRLAAYQEDVEASMQRLGDQHSPFALFLRSLLPWNGLQNMALGHAMAERGVEDPVTAERRRRRQEARAALDRDLEEDDSSDEEEID